MVTLIKGDCMDLMRDTPDKCYDLVMADPEYGIGFGDYERGSMGLKTKERYTKNGKKTWDSKTPPPIYFTELMRVSKNQIICGGNYFILPPTQCFVFWYKRNPVPNFADGEYIWTSFQRPALCYDYQYYGGLSGNTKKETTIHPTEKPISLYKYFLKQFAKPGDKILDTHGGSWSSVIACIDGGFDITSTEKDSDYFEAGVKRVQNHMAQLDCFIERPEIKIIR